MGRRYKKFSDRKASRFRYNRNEYIRAKQLLVIDEDGTKLGVLDLDKAIEIARDKELDLIEVSPNSSPPVAKVYSWSKFKYEQSKKEKEAKKKKLDLKEMWFKAFIDKGDLDHKIKKVKEFLDKKHPVKLTIKGKGRVSRQNIKGLMDEVLKLLGDEIQYEYDPKYAGRNMSLLVRPGKPKSQNKKDSKHEEKDKNTQGNSKKVQTNSKRKSSPQ